MCYRRCDDIAEAAADARLCTGKVVGWFQGRMEAGPRALGGRSIIADPRAAAMSDTVNDKVKFRERWRPFALSILAEKAADYLVRGRRRAVHGDGLRGGSRSRIGDRRRPCTPSDRTTRPHTVGREVNPQFWALIDAFHRRTGVPGVLNTSFNVKGEPIVCNPTDALRCFYGTGMDALAIGSFLLEKASARSRDVGSESDLHAAAAVDSEAVSRRHAKRDRGGRRDRRLPRL